MSKKQREPKPTPRDRPAKSSTAAEAPPRNVGEAPSESAAVDVSDAAPVVEPLDVRLMRTTVFAGRKMTIEQDGPISFEFATCRICGSRMTTDVCPVDGWRFEVNQ